LILAELSTGQDDTHQRPASSPSLGPKIRGADPAGNQSRIRKQTTIVILGSSGRPPRSQVLS